MVENKCSFLAPAGGGDDSENALSPQDRFVMITRKLQEEQMPRQMRSRLERRLRNIRNELAKKNPPPPEDPKDEVPKLTRRLEEEQMSRQMRQRLQKRLRNLRKKLADQGINPAELEGGDPKESNDQDGKVVLVVADSNSNKGSVTKTTSTKQEGSFVDMLYKENNKPALPELMARLASDIGGKLKMDDLVDSLNVGNDNVEKNKKIQTVGNNEQAVKKLKQRLANINGKIQNLELRRADVERQLAEKEKELLVQVEEEDREPEQEPQRKEEEMTIVFHDSFANMMGRLDTARQGLADMDAAVEDDVASVEEDEPKETTITEEEEEVKEKELADSNDNLEPTSDTNEENVDGQEEEEEEEEDIDETLKPSPEAEQQKVSFPVLTKRLAGIEQKLSKEEDPSRRRELLKRWASVEKKLSGKKRNQAIQQSPFPGLTKQLLNIEEQLEETEESEDPARYHNLIQRKANVEAKLAEKLKMQAIEQGPFPILNMKLAKIDEQLKGMPESPQRGELEKTKAMLLIELAEKREMMDAYPGGNLSRQVERTQALLAETNVTPERRYSLQKRLSHLQNRQEEASLSLQSILSSDSSADAAAAGKKKTKEEDPCPEQEKKVLVQTERLASAANTNEKAASTEKKEDPRRQQEKDLLMERERLARALASDNKPRKNKKETILNSLALQQVYVAYYSDITDDDYIPVLDNKKFMEQHAVIRQEAIKLARSSSVRVDWIADDMYQRLPESWSLDDEIKMFGGRKQKSQLHQRQQSERQLQPTEPKKINIKNKENNNNNNNKATRRRSSAVVNNMDTLDDSFTGSVLPEYWHMDDSKAELLEDGFEKVIMEANMASTAGAGIGDWMDV